MNYHLFAAFLLITFVLVIVPGPIVTLVIATGATRGTRAALITVIGTTLGNAALLAGIALGRIGVGDLARNVRVVQSFRPAAANRAVYDERYAEFRILHKQTSRRTKRNARHT